MKKRLISFYYFQLSFGAVARIDLTIKLFATRHWPPQRREFNTHVVFVVSTRDRW